MPTSRPVDAVTAPIPVAKDPEMERALDKRYAGKPAEKEAMRNTMAELDARLNAEDRITEINQRSMVVPAPADFRPEPIARKIKLKLVLEKSKIKVGENPRFRLELTNIGREPINYQEYESSIFKGGSIGYSMRTISFYLTDKRGKRLDLLPAMGTGRAEPIRYHDATPKSEEEMRETNARSQASTTFRVKLLPGETLRSLGDGDTAQEPFRTLRVEEGYEKPGTYRLQVELDDRPHPLSKEYIKAALTHSTLEKIHESHERRLKKALGPVSSNTVTFEVER